MFLSRACACIRASSASRKKATGASALGRASACAEWARWEGERASGSRIWWWLCRRVGVTSCPLTWKLKWYNNKLLKQQGRGWHMWTAWLLCPTHKQKTSVKTETYRNEWSICYVSESHCVPVCASTIHPSTELQCRKQNKNFRISPAWTAASDGAVHCIERRLLWVVTEAQQWATLRHKCTPHQRVIESETKAVELTGSTTRPSLSR